MKITIYTDGGSRGNPGEAAIGIVAKDTSGADLYTQARKIGIATNNEAEYQAVLDALDWLAQPATQELLSSKNIKTVEWKLDSKLVVEQLSRRWKIKEPRIQVLATNVLEKISSLPQTMTFYHIPRSENAHADALLNAALDA
jgi:probable phosphoglycerate mutase